MGRDLTLEVWSRESFRWIIKFVDRFLIGVKGKRKSVLTLKFGFLKNRDDIGRKEDFKNIKHNGEICLMEKG